MNNPSAQAVQYRHPIPMDLTNVDDPMLVCPICGYDFIHPVGLVCFSAGSRNTRVRIDSKGVHQDPESGASGRGVRIVLEFLCENWHLFNYSFQFHKGQTTVECLARPEEVPLEKQPETIWRD